MRVIIADTSCLIVYHKIDRFDILQKMFSELIVTEEVAAEFGELPHWISVSEVVNRSQYLKLRESLGKGEASAIALALESEKRLLIIDEKKGRKIAESLGIEIIGSLGILMKAKETGVIKTVREVLDLMEQTNFRISRLVRQKLLSRMGEL